MYGMQLVESRRMTEGTFKSPFLQIKGAMKKFADDALNRVRSARYHFWFKIEQLPLNVVNYYCSN